MSEPRKNHLAIDGAQVKEEEHVATYKPIPDSDTAEFRASKTSLTKSKEKVSPDGAEEKLLQKEDEAKIVRVDMADAKYVVGDHRNGDAKIELDANKRQFSGLTKEELMKYADDPFWVNLRWCMFVLFWALWVAMLAGAITIIVRAPRCPPPTPKQWFEKYLTVESEASSDVDTYAHLGPQFKTLQTNKVEGIFMNVPTYEVLDKPDLLESFKTFAKEAKEYSIRIIVDLIPNYVSENHEWFIKSLNRTEPFTDFFIWVTNNEFDSTDNRKPPTYWRSQVNASSWTYKAEREQFYLHQYGSQYPDLNFTNPLVIAKFHEVLSKWISAGAGGVRLNKARELLVNLKNAEPYEPFASGHGAALVAHDSHPFYNHRDTTDQPGLDALLSTMSSYVDQLAGNTGESVFTLKEGHRPELYLLAHNTSSLRPPSAAPLRVSEFASNVTLLAARIADKVAGRWPFLQLKGDSIEEDQELALFSVLLPAAPVLSIMQITNDTGVDHLSDIVALRSDASIEHGNHSILPVAAVNSTLQLIVCARWKASHTGYMAVHNPASESLRANLTTVPSVAQHLTVRHMSEQVRTLTNYTVNYSGAADDFEVPAKSTLILSYVPHTQVIDSAEN